MPNQFVRVLVLLVVVLGAPAAMAAAPDPALIPKPRSLETCSGTLVLDAHSTLAAPTDARAAEIADFLREAIAAQTGVSLTPARAGVKRETIELRRDPRIADDEAYRLDIGRHGAVITASGDRGLLWGVQTLRQLLPLEKTTAVKLPCLHIDDAPALRYRGQMLDVSRHFFPVDFIKRQLDVLSFYKINTFRWHLTDDQGWRIEIKRYPRLTGVGAWRTEADGSRYGGYYTQAEVREVVEYARRLGIMVIPEIEMPGHSTAALVAYPEYACQPPPREVPTMYGVHLDIYCAGKEETFRFLEGVLDEVIVLFPAPYLHIGGDEVPKDRWQACAPCQALIQREGLKDEHELQSWFVRRVQRYLRSKGRTLIGWDEILEGGADSDAIVEVWRGEAEGRKALANGNRIISAGPYYLDSPLDKLSLQEIYRRDPLADPAYRAAGAQVWGAEAPLWSERVTPLNGEAMLYPRMLAFAEITWNATARDFDEFALRLQPHYRWLASMGVAYGPADRAIVSYALAYDRDHQHWRLQAQHGFADMCSHYVLDGRAPSADAPSFDREITITQPGALRVAPFRGARQALDATGFQLVSHQALGAQATFAAAPKRPDADATDILTDGILGGADFGDGSWGGWQGPDLDVAVDLGSTRSLHRISMNFLQQAGAWIVLPREVSYAVSDDGKRWRVVHRVDTQADGLRPDRFVRQVAWRSAQPVRARWVRVLARSYGPLPPGHVSAGQPSWVFADEIAMD